MYFGGFLRPRAGSWPLRMAIRATLAGITGIVAGSVIDSTALPRIKAESKGLSAGPPASLAWVSVFEGRLKFVPVPALLLGVTALTLRSARGPLAISAMIAGGLAFVVIVGSLVAALAPMYQVPRDLGVP